MRIIALLFALILTGCSGNRLNAETKPTAVALSAPSIAATFADTVMAATAIIRMGGTAAAPSANAAVDVTG